MCSLRIYYIPNHLCALRPCNKGCQKKKKNMCSLWVKNLKWLNEWMRISSTWRLLSAIGLLDPLQAMVGTGVAPRVVVARVGEAVTGADDGGERQGQWGLSRWRTWYGEGVERKKEIRTPIIYHTLLMYRYISRLAPSGSCHITSALRTIFSLEHYG